jgi:hypothetical protein
VLVSKSGIAQGSRCIAPPKRGSARGRRSCQRYVKVASFTHTDLTGPNHVHFSGRVGSHKLASARYRLEATPRANGRTGATLSAAFTIAR